MRFSDGLNVHDSFGVIKTVATHSPFGVEHEEVGLTGIEYDGKVIIDLCGNNTKSPLKAGMYGRNSLNLLMPELRRDVTAYSIYYPKQQPLFNNLTPNPLFDYNQLAETLFDKIITKDGKNASIDEITEQFGNITFFGHSVGGFVMNELMYGLDKLMRERDFSNKDINKTFSSIVFVGYAPFALVDAPINNIIVAPIYDSVGSTKLVYDKIKNDDVLSSNSNIKLQNGTLNGLATDMFLEKYQSMVNNEDVVYFANSNSIFATPNLLYNDGIKEDHNLAGVGYYPKGNPYQTKAGILTTDFLRDVLSYGVAADRKHFSIRDLYFRTTQKETDNIKC